MEREGIIQGYTALIDKTALGLNFFAMILVNPIASYDLDEITDKIKKEKMFFVFIRYLVITDLQFSWLHLLIKI